MVDTFSQYLYGPNDELRRSADQLIMKMICGCEEDPVLKEPVPSKTHSRLTISPLVNHSPWAGQCLKPQTALGAWQAARSLPWSPWSAYPGRRSFRRWSLAPSPPSWGTPEGPPCWAGSCAGCSCHYAEPHGNLESPWEKWHRDDEHVRFSLSKWLIVQRGKKCLIWLAVQSWAIAVSNERHNVCLASVLLCYCKAKNWKNYL